MMKRILLALALILFAQPTFADTWSVGQQAFTFVKVGTNVVGDGTTSQGGIAPAYENGTNPFEPADIADNFAPGYTTTANTRCTYPVAGAAGAVNCGTLASEAKFRTLCNFGFVGQFDMIVFPGQNNVGHLHMFSGNTAAVYSSNYSQLRQNGESTCAGNKNNRSSYWAPATLIDLPTGYTAVFKFKNQTVYYTLNPASRYINASRIPRDFAYIGGYDPADPNNTKLTVPMATGNTAGCTGGGCRYALPPGLGEGTSSATGFVGWRCLATDLSTAYDGHTVNAPVGGQVQPYLRNAAGQATLACPVNGGLLAEILMPDCWDGKNLHSGGSTGGGVGGVNLPSSSGRLHVSYRVHDNNTGQDVCPTGTWQIPVFQTKYIWALGTTDVSKIYLSSDVMNYGAPDPTSRSPCRQVSSHYCYGETFHSDWYGAWGYGTAAAPGIMLKWMNHCNGVAVTDSTGTLAADPAECDTSTIDSVTALQISGTTSGGLPFGNPSTAYTGTDRYVPVVAGSTGNGRMHHGIPCTVANPCQMPMNDNIPMPANDNQTHLAGAASVVFDLRRAGR